MDKDIIETTDLDIVNVNSANYWLDYYLNDEGKFIRVLVRSEPLQFLMSTFNYSTFLKLKQVPRWGINPDKDPDILEAKTRAREWAPSVNENTINRIARTILIMTALAEKRLNGS